jgi:tetratricopeptide (TPR) repeat protein
MRLSDYAKRLAATSNARDRSDRSEDEIAQVGAFEVSFRDIEREYPAAAALMTLCAFLEPDDIPLEVIRDGAKYLPEPLQAACTSPEAFNAAVAPLLFYALARRDGEALFVHRIVQRLVRERLSGKERGHWAGCAAQLLNGALPATSIEIFDPDIGRIYDRLVPHGLAAAAHAEAAAVAPWETAWLFADIGVHQQVRGDLSLARPNLERALALFEGLVAADPGNAGWQRDLSVSHNKMGDVLRAQGNLPAALESYRASHDIFERLAAADPGNAGWQRDLSVSHNKMGDVLWAQGNLPAALESYRASLAIRERLAAADPGNAGWQRDLAFSHWQLAQHGNQPGFHWQKVVGILRELEKQGHLAPADQKGLSVAEEKLAAATQ